VDRSKGIIKPFFAEDNKQGLTLIEILLSIFLVALISGILFASFFLPQRAVSAAKSELITTEEATVFLFRLSEEIAGIYPQQGSFIGKKDLLSFLTTAGTESGLEAVAYTVKKEPSEEKAIIFRASQLPWQGEKKEGSPVLETTDLIFSYYDGKEWFDQWQNEENPPRLISVKLTRKGVEWEILCALRAGTGSDTDIDSHSGTGGSGTTGLS